MWKNQRAVFNKKPIFSKLVTYGFTKQAAHYTFTTDVMDGAFRLTIYVSESGITELEVVDTSTGEEYALVNVTSSVGAFVCSVRAQCESILQNIVVQCYEPDIFKSDQAKQVIAFMRSKYGVEAEYLWEKFPNNAVFREPTSEKWFAALLSVEKRKIGIDADGSIEIIDLKEKPDRLQQLVDGQTFLPGYHMNKKHWYTIRLDGSVPTEEICRRIDHSLQTLKKGKK